MGIDGDDRELEHSTVQPPGERLRLGPAILPCCVAPQLVHEPVIIVHRDLGYRLLRYRRRGARGQTPRR